MGDTTFEPEDAGLMQKTLAEYPSVEARAEAFLQALRPLVETLLLLLKALRRRIPELERPLVIARQVVQRCAATSASAQSAAVAAFHVAHNSESELEFAAMHFLSAAWYRELRGPVQLH